MRLNHCPHCRTRSGLSDYCTLLLSLESWPVVLIYSLLVIAMGQKPQFSQPLVATFVAITVAPLLFRVIRKQACENCGAEFRTGEPKVASQSTDLL